MRVGPTAALAVVLLLAVAVADRASAAPRATVVLHDGWSFRQVGQGEWHPAKVPGVVHLDLADNRLIGDPFFGDNEKGLQWIGRADWEYRSVFEVPPEVLGRRHLELVFDGLDTYATVFLNGRRILEADNFYRQWRADAAGLERTNELRIVFRSPIEADRAKVGARGYELPAANDQGEKTSVYSRKAPYQFGWDWGPRFVTCGIWKPVRLEAWDEARIADLLVRQDELGDERARLTARVELRTDTAGEAAPVTVDVRVDGSAGPLASAPVRLEGGTATAEVPLEIVRPRRWWPNGYGEQALYSIKVRLRVDGQVVDEAATRVGLRTLELRRAPDLYGKSFEFVVNGVPVFAKGANWIPADSFPSRIGRDRYADLLRSARDAHMNMLRVWGGGIYESDAFYDLADEMGLLLWQDFHFSCSLYPGDEPFLANVEAEAEQAVRRLRNHPSLALWNGNNEIEAAWFQWGWKRRLPASLWNDYEAIFHRLLPRTVARLDPTRSYWPSSPSANREAEPGDPGNGDAHYWGVWHAGEPFSAFERQKTRFMSEYGFQSFPEMRTLRSFAGDDDLAIDSPVMTSHQKHPRGNQLIREYMLRDYREPKDFASFVYVSQVLQAEGIKRGAEHLRRSRPRTMGSLYWQLDDCWPVASWSSIDYFGRWKALHYYARRFYADLLLSTSEDDGGIAVHAVSDLGVPVRGRLEALLLDLSGATRWKREEDVTVAPLASAEHLRIPRAEELPGWDAATTFLAVRLMDGERTLAETLRFFVPTRDLRLGQPRISAAVVGQDGGFAITLKTDTLARHVRLSYAADDGRFTDNYFDLVPGRPVALVYRPKDPTGLEAFRKGLEVASIVDTFASPPAGDGR